MTAAGPDAPVPTCPKWTVSRLVGHLGRVHSLVREAVAHPHAGKVSPEPAPDGWAAVLAWQQAQSAAMLDALGAGPDAPAWLPFPGYAKTTGSWARRQAHEGAIHRLDADTANGDGTPLFDPAFAADGVDEMLTALLPFRPWTDSAATGSVLVHAADAGRVWMLELREGVPPVVADGTSATFDADVTVAGTADAVYRRIWGRPSDASVIGDVSLLEPLAAP
ncbi:maleylpyruvate isomerase N-terminal domain-containing protein [Amycolatopsis sp. CA-230715]|uniref:maleylpyruvate isomerase N-terminal domain-containing protein n=1 Tax=Amycolatopsis sp. CA-230715 TaxID=2745196 RepID=UPI0020B25ECC|nr:maleylpyruvate isomerase N-terminal domain-containing protein [Amycolatopsis sp. CA-230715]